MDEAFAVTPAHAKLLAYGDTAEMQRMSREVLVFSRAEVNDEKLASADYQRTTTRVNHYVGVDYQVARGKKHYVGYLHHFLRIPHPSVNHSNAGPGKTVLKQPLRLAMISFYEPRSTNPPRMVRVNTAKYQGKYYAVNPASIQSKYVVAFEECKQGQDEYMCCMTYHALTGNR